ncbi:MAG: antibiotic biosynthesis monooxygenase [Betaproteobacteria bacterium]|nr:antibiotic biosynthesis monooxygenase [Betaproteobacteria bacterium]NBY34067.1 antibiotic biosynthesis monooxygenase [Betaproteobacteria bacterium]
MDNHKTGPFFKSALSRGAASLGLALFLAAAPLASMGQTADSFVLVTVQLNLKPGKVEALSKEVLENALKETRRFEGLIGLEVYAEQGGDTVLIIEKWKSKAHNEKYREWRKTSGFGPVVAPYVTGPSVVRYFDPRPE